MKQDVLASPSLNHAAVKMDFAVRSSYILFITLRFLHVLIPWVQFYVIVISSRVSGGQEIDDAILNIGLAGLIFTPSSLWDFNILVEK